MEEAALIIAVVALILTLVVAGFGIVLQMLIYRASTDQLLNIGKESASLSASIAMSLGQIHQTTTITQDTVSRQIEQITGRLLDGVFADQARPIPEGETADAHEEPVEPAEIKWVIDRMVSQARYHSPVGRMLTFLGHEDEGRSRDDIREHFKSGEMPDNTGFGWAMDIFFALGSFGALNAVDPTGDKWVLTETGKLAFVEFTRQTTASP